MKVLTVWFNGLPLLLKNQREEINFKSYVLL